MNYVRYDFHTRFQEIAMLNVETGELQEKRLYHDGKEVEAFYGSLVAPTVVGIESTGYSIWFHELLEDLGVELKVGDAAKIRAQQVRKKKNDEEDARLTRKLLVEGRDLRQVLTRRRQRVKTCTGVKNSLQSLALNPRLALGSGLFTRAGREAFRKLKLRPYARQMGSELWEQLEGLQGQLGRLEKILQAEAKGRPEAVLLQSHPGVGAMTALAWVLIIGPVQRFASAAQLAAYVGLVPAEYSSAGRLRRFYRRLVVRRGIQVAKTAAARKLSNRLYLMHREGIDYAEFRRRDLLARSARRNS